MPPRMSGSTDRGQLHLAAGLLGDPVADPAHGLLVELDRRRSPRPAAAGCGPPTAGRSRGGCGRSPARGGSPAAARGSSGRSPRRRRRRGAARPSSRSSRSRARRRTPAAGDRRRARRRTRRAARAPRRACPRRARPRTASGRRRRRSPPSPLSAPRPATARRSPARPRPRRPGVAGPRSVSVLRVTFSVARIVRSATSARISWIARRVSVSMSLRACSSSSSRRRLPAPDRVRLLLLAGLAGAGDDVVGLLARGRQALAVLRQQLVGLPARALGRVDRVLDRLLALVERLGDARERDLVEDVASICRRGTASRPSARCPG